MIHRGCFYGLIGCADLIGAQTTDGNTLSDDAEIIAYILKDVGIAAVSGSAYELSPFFCISTAALMDVLDQAMDRIATSVAKLKRKTSAMKLKKLVLTGAAGRLGSYLREPLSKMCDGLVSTDIVDDIGTLL